MARGNLRLPVAPATHGGVPVRRIDTHAAAGFLAGQRALKVKRAVRYPYLDFSTLEKRKAACEAELDVNRPFAPGLYRGVTAITREVGGRLANSIAWPPSRPPPSHDAITLLPV